MSQKGFGWQGDAQSVMAAECGSLKAFLAKESSRAIRATKKAFILWIFRALSFYEGSLNQLTETMELEHMGEIAAA